MAKYKKQSMMKDAIILCMISLIAALALGFVNELTKDRIAFLKAQEKAEAYQEVFPEAVAIVDKENDTTLKVINYYMTMTDKQYLHFAKEIGKKFFEIGTYQSEHKSLYEMVINKCVELSIVKYGDPLRNLTVAEVAKDLKMGENLANQLFRRPDFPAVNIGKTKTVCALAYIVWKMQHRDSEVIVNE